MPAAGFVRQGVGSSAWVPPRAAVVGGLPAGGLRRDRSATMTVPLLTLMVLIVAFGAEPAAGDIG